MYNIYRICERCIFQLIQSAALKKKLICSILKLPLNITKEGFKIMSNFSVSDLAEGSYIHMIGIGGISMSGIAEMLLNFGFKVSGSDMKASNLTERLQQGGAEIIIGQAAENIKNPSLVCYTAAISPENPELKAAREKGIPCIERAVLLGALLEKYKYPIAVAGTHGKTTTSSMLSLVLLSAEKDPTILIGGELKQIGGNYHIGGNEYLPFEACEYVESFLHFKPFVSIITNIEEDHMDYFKDLNHIKSSFVKFASLTSDEGCNVVCTDGDTTDCILQDVKKKALTYGISNKTADYTANNIQTDAAGFPEFDICCREKTLLHVKLNVAGSHNICNAVGVAAACDFLGIDTKYIKQGLESFDGTKRRFDRLGKTKNGTDVVDDYAHHPTEIKTTIETAKKMGYNNVWVAFQPHTYTRTAAFLENFAKALNIADRVMIADIYPAREKYDGTIHACDLAALIPGVVYMNDMNAMKKYILENAASDDLVITMGAGNICDLGYALVEEK